MKAMNEYKKKLLLNILTLFIGLVLFSAVTGQNKTIDSLQAVISKQREDTNKVKNLITFVFLKDSSQSNSKLLIQYGKEILALSKKLNYKTGQSVGYLWITKGFSYTTDYLNRINYYDSAIQYFTAIKDEATLVAYLVDVGILYESLEDTASALNYYNKALGFYQKNKNKLQISRLLNVIGELYREQGKYDEALQKHLAALAICKAPDFEDQFGWGLPYCYQSIGTLYEKKADANVREIKKETSFADYKIAMAYYDSSLQLWRKIEAKRKWPFLDVIGSFGELNYQKGSIYLKTGDFPKAQEMFQQALKFYSQTEYNILLDELYLAISKLDSINGDYQSAYSHYKLYIAQKEPLNKVEATRKVESLKFKNELDNKEYQIKLLSTESRLQTTLSKQHKQKKNIAYIGTVLLVLTGSYGFIRFRKKRKQQSQQALIEERLRISSDLHDEVGATLSGIAMYSHLTKEQLKSNNVSGINNSLDIMQQNSRQMVDKLNEIVWFINPDQDTLKQLFIRLEDYTYKMAAIKDIKTVINKPDHLADLLLSTELRRNVYLFCKEAVNNAVKHSNASLLELTIKENEGLFEFEIKDNGKAFDASAIAHGNGMGNMQKRAEALGGQMQVASSTGKGTVIRLQVKITR